MEKREKLIVGIGGKITVGENVYIVECGMGNWLGFDWAFKWHWDEYDGAPDAGRQYTGEARTFAELFEQIREAEEERAEEEMEV